VRVPYAQLDLPVRALVRILNGFPGIHTVASCGGHETPGPAGNPAGQWEVRFTVDHAEDGWYALEWLAWITQDARQAGKHVSIRVSAAPPYLNTPGESLFFTLYGDTHGEAGQDPDELAAWIKQQKAECYYTPAEWAARPS
jgi:hypothetical protein